MMGAGAPNAGSVGWLVGLRAAGPGRMFAWSSCARKSLCFRGSLRYRCLDTIGDDDERGRRGEAGDDLSNHRGSRTPPRYIYSHVPRSTRLTSLDVLDRRGVLSFSIGSISARRGVGSSTKRGRAARGSQLRAATLACIWSQWRRPCERALQCRGRCGYFTRWRGTTRTRCDIDYVRRGCAHGKRWPRGTTLCAVRRYDPTRYGDHLSVDRGQRGISLLMVEFFGRM